MDNIYVVNQAMSFTGPQAMGFTGPQSSGIQGTDMRMSQIRHQQAVANSTSQFPSDLRNNASYINNTNNDMLSYNLNVFGMEAPRSRNQNRIFGNATINREFLNTDSMNQMPLTNVLQRSSVVNAREFPNTVIFGQTPTGVNNVYPGQPTVGVRHGQFTTSHINNGCRRTPLVDRRDILNGNVRLQQNAAFQHPVPVSTNYVVPNWENFANNNHQRGQSRKQGQDCSISNNARHATNSNNLKYSVFNLKPSSSNGRETSIPNQIAENTIVQPIEELNNICQTTNQCWPMTPTTIPCHSINDADQMYKNGENSADDVCYLQNWYRVPSVTSCTQSDKEQENDYQQTMEVDYTERPSERGHELYTETNDTLLTVVTMDSNNQQNQEDNVTFNETTKITSNYPITADNSETNTTGIVNEDMDIEPPTTSHVDRDIEPPTTSHDDRDLEPPTTSHVDRDIEPPTTSHDDRDLEPPTTSHDDRDLEPPTTSHDDRDLEPPTTSHDDRDLEPPTTSLSEPFANNNIQNGDSMQQNYLLTERNTVDFPESGESVSKVTTIDIKANCNVVDSFHEETETKPQIGDNHHNIASVESMKSEEKCMLEAKSDKSNSELDDVISCSRSQFYVIFHKKKLLCFGKGKYLLMREFLHNFFDKDQQKKVYKLKMKLKIPFVSLPDQYRNGTLKYLNMKYITGVRNISYIGLIRIHQANQLYHIMSGNKDCNGGCVRLYKSKKKYGGPPNTESDCGGKVCPNYSFPTAVRSPDEGYESVDASPYAGETIICDSKEESKDASSKETKTHVPDMCTLPDDRMYKGGLMELFNKTFRYIEIYEDKFLPLCDVTEIFDKTEVSATIRKGNINVFRCTPLEAGYLNQFTDFKEVETDDEIVHERLLRHICLRPDAYTKDQETISSIGDAG